MKKYVKELVIYVLQLFMFYIFPLFAGPTDMMGMVLLIIISTFVLSVIMGSISKEKIKYLYPIIVAVIFIPTVMLYYNSSALIHSVWYLVVSAIGLLIGTIIYKLIQKNSVGGNYMKTIIKKVLIVIGVIFGIILLDSIQALVFDNNPIIGIQTRNMKKVGILVDTHHCGNGKHDTVIKGFSYSCNYEGGNYTLVDETKNKKDFACDDALESFYEDEKYTYFWSCIKNDYMVVKYDDGSKELISEALKNEHIEIQILDKFNISYIKEEKFQMYQETPPELFIYLDGETNKAKALLGTHSWKIIKDGKEEIIAADSLHPSQIKYDDVNTLKYKNTKIKIDSMNATITSANIYNMNKTEKLKKISFDNETIMLGDLQKGEYVLEIVANYSQGKSYYGIKIVVE